MKIRQGFVSNSSSSSFVCDITGESHEGYDGEYDCTYAECEAGHCYAADDIPEVMEYIENGSGEDDEDDRYERQYSIPKSICPICNGKVKNIIIERIKKDLTRYNIDVKELA